MHQETGPRPGGRFYYGWVIVAVAVVSMAFWFGFRSIFSVFMVALVDLFGWGHAEISGVQSVAMIGYIIAAALAGIMVWIAAPAKGQALKKKMAARVRNRSKF